MKRSDKENTAAENAGRQKALKVKRVEVVAPTDRRKSSGDVIYTRMTWNSYIHHLLASLKSKGVGGTQSSVAEPVVEVPEMSFQTFRLPNYCDFRYVQPYMSVSVPTSEAERNELNNWMASNTAISNTLRQKLYSAVEGRVAELLAEIRRKGVFYGDCVVVAVSRDASGRREICSMPKRIAFDAIDSSHRLSAELISISTATSGTGVKLNIKMSRAVATLHAGAASGAGSGVELRATRYLADHSIRPKVTGMDTSTGTAHKIFVFDSEDTPPAPEYSSVSGGIVNAQPFYPLTADGSLNLNDTSDWIPTYQHTPLPASEYSLPIADATLRVAADRIWLSMADGDGSVGRVIWDSHSGVSGVHDSNFADRTLKMRWGRLKYVVPLYDEPGKYRMLLLGENGIYMLTIRRRMVNKYRGEYVGEVEWLSNDTSAYEHFDMSSASSTCGVIETEPLRLETVDTSIGKVRVLAPDTVCGGRVHASLDGVHWYNVVATDARPVRASSFALYKLRLPYLAPFEMLPTVAISYSV